MTHQGQYPTIFLSLKDTRHYATDLQALGITNILQIGLAFRAKEVAVIGAIF